MQFDGRKVWRSETVNHRTDKFEDTKLETVNQRRKDNSTAKRKRTKGQTTIYKTLHRKLKIEKLESNKKKLG